MSRTRSKSITNPITGGIHNIQRYYGNGSITKDQTSNWNTTNTAFTTTMTDSVTPGYFSSVRNGSVIPVNSMTRSGFKSFDSTPVAGYWKVKYNSTGVFVHENYVYGDIISWISASAGGNYPNYSQTKGWLGLSTNPSSPSDTNSLIEALANVNTNTWDVGTFLAEFNKTVSMITKFKGNVLDRGERIYRSLKGRKIRPGEVTRSGLTAFSESWLEYRYGWRTLSYDLQDISTSLQRLNGLKSRPKRGSSYHVNSATYSQSGNISSPSTNPGPIPSMVYLVSFNCSLQQTRERSVRGTVMVEALGNDLAFVDPLTTAWEIVPFSFIVDWFTNIGDLIKAYSPFLSGNVLASCLSYHDTVTTTTTVVPSDVRMKSMYYNPQHTFYMVCPSGIRTHVSDSYSRVPASPTFTLNVKLNVDPSKLVDLSALFALASNRLLGKVLKLTRT